MKCFYLLLLLTASTAWAQPREFAELKVQGKTYKSVKVTKVNSDSISISHESGTSRILLKKLPTELQKQFGYDYAQAEASRKEREQKEAQVKQIRVNTATKVSQKEQEEKAALKLQEGTQKAKQAALHAEKQKTTEQFRPINAGKRVPLKGTPSLYIEHGGYKGVIIYSNKLRKSVALFGANHSTDINCYATQAKGIYDYTYPIYIKVGKRMGGSIPSRSPY